MIILFNFYPLAVVSRYRDLQLQVGKNYLHVYNLNQSVCFSLSNYRLKRQVKHHTIIL